MTFLTRRFVPGASCAAWLITLICGAVLASVGRVSGQGTFDPIIMRTGTGAPLQTNDVPFNSLGGEPVLTVQFGFATAEVPSPGVFKDSFTLALSGAAGTFYLLTADANGVAWTPLTPGGLTVPGGSLTAVPAQFAIPSEGLPVLASYTVNFALPQGWEGLPLSVHLDFFDNQDNTASLAYAGVTVIPEPTGMAILLAGLGVLGWFRRQA